MRLWRRVLKAKTGNRKKKKGRGWREWRRRGGKVVWATDPAEERKNASAGKKSALAAISGYRLFLGFGHLAL